jgi:hypothetical protein
MEIRSFIDYKLRAILWGKLTRMPGLWYKAVTLIDAIRNVRYKVNFNCRLKHREAYKIMVQL